MKTITIAAITLVCLTLTGCHTLQKDAGDGVERDWLGRKIEVEYKTPSKIVAIWSNTVFNRPGESPKRGLGGRIYFYDEEHRTVPVDGTLSVYVYDDTDSMPGDRLEQEASRAFHFDSEELKAKLDPTEFGSSYSLWLPWDEVGGDRKQLGVIPVFTDAAGAIIAGEQSRQLLPGKEPVEFLDEEGNPVVQASYTTHSRESVRISQGARPRVRREAKSFSHTFARLDATSPQNAATQAKQLGHARHGKSQTQGFPKAT